MIEILGLDTIIPEELTAGLSQDAVQIILGNIADATLNEWVKLASTTLSTRREDYINGIKEVDLKPGIATISLVGEFPNLIEHGSDPIDMRKFLLGPNVPVLQPGGKGKGKRLNKEGQAYRAIPFTHTPPGSTSKVGQAMGSPYEGHSLVEDAMKLGKDIYDQAKGLTATTSDPYKGSDKAGRLKSPIGGQLAPLLKDTHKTNIYEGMIRKEKTYRKKTESTFVTFRVISEAEPDGWRRKEIKGVNLMKEASKFAEKEGIKSFEAYVKGLTGG